MKKIILIMSAILLSGCATTKDPNLELGRSIQVPELPSSLNQRANRLPPLRSGSMAAIQRDGVATDRAYNDLAHRYNAIIDLWACVRQAVNNRDATAMEACAR